MKKNKVKNKMPKYRRNTHRDELRALPSSQVSEPTKAPYVVWSVKHRTIVSEHKSKRSAIADLKQLRKDVKAGKYD